MIGLSCKRRLGLGLAASVAMLGAAPAGAAPKEAAPPNVVIMIVDDMNDWAGFAGGPALTPHLDRLAAQGLVFTNMQAPATFCTPSRSAFMTGSHPTRSGNYRNQPALHTTPHLATIPAFLAKRGYAGFGAGKVFHHMPGYVDFRGYDDYFIWNSDLKAKGWGLRPWSAGAPSPPRPSTQIPRYTGWPEFDYARLSEADEARMADTLSAEWAAQVVSRRHDRPFLVTVGLFAPHKPNYVPGRYFDMYRGRTLPRPATPEDDLSDVPGDPHKKPLCCVSPLKPTIGSGAWPAHRLIVEHGDWDNALLAYAASISYADAQLGKVITALESGPNSRNTIVFFLSDNGYHLGEKDKWAKHSLWQRTTNVPFFAWGPGVRPGRYDGAASLLDIFPTVARAAGGPKLAQFDGEDLTKVLESGRSARDRLVLTSGNFGEYAVTGRRYRYIRYAGGGEELYDRKDDPHEWRNLVGDARHASALRRLRAAVPKSPAAPLPDEETGELELVLDGERFHWRASSGDPARSTSTE